MSYGSWAAVDNGFHHNAKVIRLRRTARGLEALGLWTVCLSWTCADPKGWHTGRIPLVVVEDHARCDDWQDLLDALVDVGLWTCDGELVTFANWSEWNGPDAKHNRSVEQTRRRKVLQRVRDCQAGKHSKDCPTKDVDDEPWTCPKRAQREAQKKAREDAHAGRDTARHVTPEPEPVSESEPETATSQLEEGVYDPWARSGETA